jgi:hypothetical protein
VELAEGLRRTLDAVAAGAAVSSRPRP